MRAETVSVVTKLGEVFAPVATLLLGCSIVFDYFYLTALGLDFKTVPTEIVDHVRSAIIWIPFAVAATVGVLFLNAAKISEEKIYSLRTPSFAVRIAIVLAGVVLFVIQTVFVTDRYLFYAVVMAWLFLLGPLVLKNYEIERIELKRIVVFVPCIIALIGNLGYSEGMRTLRRNEPSLTVVLKTADATQMRPLLGMRWLGSVAILVETDRRVTVVKADTIEQVQTISSQGFQLLACEWFGHRCIELSKP